MSMSLIKIYRTPTTTTERLPTEQQNGYHGVATEQFIEGEYALIGIMNVIAKLSTTFLIVTFCGLNGRIEILPIIVTLVGFVIGCGLFYINV